MDKELARFCEHKDMFVFKHKPRTTLGRIAS